MNLKEYYKEILNNLLMTEATASPKNQPVKPGSLRHERLQGLQKELARNQAEGGSHYRSKRIAHLMRAKGMNSSGDINIQGHAARQADAKISNSNRTGVGAIEGKEFAYNWNDKRTPEQKQRMGNEARFHAQSQPGGDD